MKQNILVSGAAAAAALLLLSACQFKSPTIAEQKYLMEKGAFPGGIPAWVATPSAGGSLGGGGVFSGGLIPQTFTGSTIKDTTTAAPTAEQSRSSAGTFKAPAAIAAEESPAEDREDASPLSRIAKSCPSIESEVNDALTTVDLQQRIHRYESLTIRCPQSADIWLWLGKDYLKDGQDVKAGRSFEKVLVIDNDNKEASDLLIENRRKLNSGADKKDESAQAQ